MTVGILSDTHSCYDSRYAEHLAECDEIWHAGDIGDLGTLQQIMDIGPRVRAVCGNIDPTDVRRMCPELLDFDAEGCHTVMTHIGGYPGHYGRGVASMIAQRRPRLFVCGHSHILRAVHDPRLDCLVLNPGAAGHHGWQKVRTLMRLTITDGVPRNLEVIELGNR